MALLDHNDRQNVKDNADKRCPEYAAPLYYNYAADGAEVLYTFGPSVYVTYGVFLKDDHQRSKVSLLCKQLLCVLIQRTAVEQPRTSVKIRLRSTQSGRITGMT